MAIQPSKEFPSLGFDYDPKNDLYFKAIVKENLRKLIKGFHDMPFTENKLRGEAGLPLRTKYFSDD